jgi:predicted naringenin-chalcone synthase
MQMLMAVLVILVGLGLMTAKIHADSEPGLVPLLLVAAGMAWLVLAGSRRRRRG